MRSSILVLLLFCVQPVHAADAPQFSKAPKWSALFQGVEGTSIEAVTPRPLSAYAVRIHLKTDGISFLATPKSGMPDAETDGLKTSTFLKTHKLQLAINAAPYLPVAEREGGAKNVQGFHVSRGQLVSPAERDLPALLLSKTNQATIAKPPFPKDGIENAVGGFQIVLAKNAVIDGKPDLHPRTAAGVTADGRTMIWLVIDGRQKGFSEGVSTGEVGAWLKALGCSEGINLDGGGTTTLVMQQPDGSAKVLNRPIHGGKPGTERVSGSHLGLFAKPLP